MRGRLITSAPLLALLLGALQLRSAQQPPPTADQVAKAVEHALTVKRPKARYLVGRDAHIRAWIERLPTGLRDRVLARALTR